MFLLKETIFKLERKTGRKAAHAKRYLKSNYSLCRSGFSRENGNKKQNKKQNKKSIIELDSIEVLMNCVRVFRSNNAHKICQYHHHHHHHHHHGNTG